MKLTIAIIWVFLLGNLAELYSSDTKVWVLNAHYGDYSFQDRSDGLPETPYDEMLRRVAILSNQTGVANLRDANLGDRQTEIRIWKGFGLISPRCFILTTRNGKATASLLAAKVRENKAVIRNGSLVYVSAPLNSPRSGWDSFLTYLSEHGIGSTVDLALDKRYLPDFDSEELVLEMKGAAGHSMAYYNDSTTSVDGKMAFDICRRIRSEFDINLGCQ